MELVLYHNPRCSKSRQTLQLLRDHGHEPQVVEYLKHPLSAPQVRGLLDKLGGAPAQLLRKKEAPFRELGLSADSTCEEVAKAIAEHPVLLERPLLVHGDRAALGRPPENVLDIL